MAKLMLLSARITSNMSLPRFVNRAAHADHGNLVRVPFPCNSLLPVRCMSRIIKKRVTRIPSDTVVHQEEIDDNQQGPNDSVPIELINRNPRNLEQLCIEPKPLGFELDKPTKTFWNKVVFEKSGKHLTAKVIHHTGRVLLSASTSEDAYRAHSDSLSDTQAAINIGTILARRCLEAGILYVHREKFNEDDSSRSSVKVSAFINALRAEGLNLREPDMIFPRRARDI